MGGMISAIENGFPQQEIMEASYQYQRSIELNERTIVGVNNFVVENESKIEILQINERVREEQVKKLTSLKSKRNNKQVLASLQRLKKAAGSEQNLFPFILECTRCYATLGEMCNSLKEVFGEYIEPSY
jgi:methylmalonyl-CoA mutase N-terminal domain/subunit